MALIDLNGLQRFLVKVKALLANYFPITGGTINGDANVAGVLRVQGQQAFYYAPSTKSQSVGTNNATGGTTICCGSGADVTVNGTNLKAPNFLPKTSNTYTLGNTTYRWKGIYSNAAVNVASDRRLKRDICLADGERLANLVRNLDVSLYNYRDDPKDAPARIGLIAQQVIAADPELAALFVARGEDGFYNLRPADFVFPLIAAVQQLEAEVVELRQKIK